MNEGKDHGLVPVARVEASLEASLELTLEVGPGLTLETGPGLALEADLGTMLGPKAKIALLPCVPSPPMNLCSGGE